MIEIFDVIMWWIGFFITLSSGLLASLILIGLILDQIVKYLAVYPVLAEWIYRREDFKNWCEYQDHQREKIEEKANAEND